MICQNCQTNVDNDLVFCTSCGTRLNETWNQVSAESADEFVGKRTSVEPVQKSSSNLKWIALIVALVAIPASLFAAYLIYNNSKQSQITTNQTKPSNSPTPLANRQITTNAMPNNAVNIVNTPNTNISNSNINSNSNSNSAETLDENWMNEEAATGGKRTEIWSDRINIAPESHFAVPFSTDGEDKIIGNIKTLQGSPVEGYVYTKAAFDEHFPNPTFKIFSFGGEKNTKIEQILIKEEYVLVFMNKTKTPLLIYGKVFTVCQ